MHVGLIWEINVLKCMRNKTSKKENNFNIICCIYDYLEK